jgi:hypothetical protein
MLHRRRFETILSSGVRATMAPRKKSVRLDRRLQFEATLHPHLKRVRAVCLSSPTEKATIGASICSKAGDARQRTAGADCVRFREEGTPSVSTARKHTARAAQEPLTFLRV